jgi:hypothetical protein
MIRFAYFFAAVITSVVLWYECGEDIVVFCYRIDWVLLRCCALARSSRCLLLK